MLTFPGFNKVAFEIGPIRVHWYGIMYLLGFAAAWRLARRKARLELAEERCRRSHLLRHARCDSRRAHRLRAVLWPDVLGERCVVSTAALGGRHVLPRRTDRCRHRADAVCLAPWPPSRRRLRFHRAAAGAGPVLWPHR